jgi:hypothetical protein
VEGLDIALPPPDFAIVGAPRCGTTAMYRYLAGHPGVAMSSQKEARFFSTDIDTGKRASSWAEYEALWDHAPSGALRGEATPDYIQSKVAISALLAARPEAKLIAMVRNPVEIVASHHAQLHVDGIENAADLETAWRLQERRQRGESLPPGCARSPAVFQYRDYAAVGDQLERFLEHVPTGQRMVIVYDDFRSNPRVEYLRVLELLQLADDGRTEFPRHNQRRAMRWRGLTSTQDWIRRSMPLLHRLARNGARALGLAPGDLLHRANVRTGASDAMRAEFAAELTRDFLPQIEKVERLLDRDLSAWKAPALR